MSLHVHPGYITQCVWTAEILLGPANAHVNKLHTNMLLYTWTHRSLALYRKSTSVSFLHTVYQYKHMCWKQMVHVHVCYGAIFNNAHLQVKELCCIEIIRREEVVMDDRCWRALTLCNVLRFF